MGNSTLSLGQFSSCISVPPLPQVLCYYSVSLASDTSPFSLVPILSQPKLHLKCIRQDSLQTELIEHVHIMKGFTRLTSKCQGLDSPIVVICTLENLGVWWLPSPQSNLNLVLEKSEDTRVSEKSSSGSRDGCSHQQEERALCLGTMFPLDLCCLTKCSFQINNSGAVTE